MDSTALNFVPRIFGDLQYGGGNLVYQFAQDQLTPTRETPPIDAKEGNQKTRKDTALYFVPRIFGDLQNQRPLYYFVALLLSCLELSDTQVFEP